VLDFLVFMVILFAFGWGSALALTYVRGRWNRLDPDLGESLLLRLQEDVEELGDRVNRMEEEIRFFGELNAPEERPTLPPEGMEEEG
jgi:hypothetical protein